jgi:predicted GIY-YIG superfamily endonuclease
MRQQHIVYVLRSESNRKRYYTGLTCNLPARLAAHHEGLSRHTADGRPWRVVVAITSAGL